MKEQLMNLKAALGTIYTKGQDTITMANCMAYIDQIIKEMEDKNVQTESDASDR